MQIEEEELNPWLSIWTRPRETIRALVDSDPSRGVIPLALGYGVCRALDRASFRSLGDELALSTILVMSLVGGSVVGVALFYITGTLLRAASALLGGEASVTHVRAAFAWSSVPVVGSLLLWIPELLLFGDELFMSEAPRVEENFMVYLGFAALEIALSVWSFVLLLKTLAEVERFSIGRALGSVLLVLVVAGGGLVLFFMGLDAIAS